MVIIPQCIPLRGIIFQVVSPQRRRIFCAVSHTMENYSVLFPTAWNNGGSSHPKNIKIHSGPKSYGLKEPFNNKKQRSKSQETVPLSKIP